MARIMVVEDDPAIRELLREILERAGYEVLDAENGKVALSLYKVAPSELVITNIVMPEKEGLEMIREMRSSDPDAKIIAISGGGQLGPADYLEVARRFGAARTFSKPFDRRELLKAVSDLLGNTC